MEQLIAAFDFHNATHETRKRLLDQIRRSNDVKNSTADDLIRALQALRVKVCGEKFPPQDSSGGYTSREVLQMIISKMCDLAKQRKIKSTGIFFDLCFDFLLDLIATGPGTTQMALWKYLFQSSLGFYEYFYNIKGKKLLSLIMALKREFVTRELDVEIEKYNAIMEDSLQSLLASSRFSAESLKEGQADFLDLYLFHKTGFLNRNVALQDRQQKIAQILSNMFKGNPFRGIGDPQIFKKQMKYLEDVICDSRFPQNEKANKIVTHQVKHLLEAVERQFIFHEVHEEILDFVSAICYKKAGCEIHKIVETVGSFYCNVNDQKKGPANIQGNTQLFESMTRKLIKLLENIKDQSFLSVEFIDAAVCDVLCKAMGNSKEPTHVGMWIQLIKACLKIPLCTVAKAASYAVAKKSQNLKWKDRVEDAKEVLELCFKLKISEGTEEREKEITGHYRDFMGYFLEQLKRDRLVKDLNDRIVQICLSFLDSRDPRKFRIAEKVANFHEFSAKKNKSIVIQVFKRFLPHFTNDKFPWENKDARSVAENLCRDAVESLSDSKVLDENELDILVCFVRALVRKDFIDPKYNRPDTVFYRVFASVGSKVIRLLDDEKKLKRASGLIEDFVDMLTSEYENIAKMVASDIYVISTQCPKTLAPHLEKMIDAYLDEDNKELLYPIVTVYPHNATPMVQHFQTFFELIDSGDQSSRSCCLMWLPNVAKQQAELFTDENVGTLIRKMFSGNPMLQSQYQMVLDPLSKKRPKLVGKHLDSLLEGDVNLQYGVYYHLLILKNIAINSDEVTAEKVMAYYEKLLNGPDDQVFTACALNEMRAVASVHKLLLQKRKPFIEKLRERTNIQSVRDSCMFVLDVMERRSLEALSEDIKSIKEDMKELDSRVTRTEEDIVEVKKEVKTQREIMMVKEDVEKQGEKFDQLKENIEERVVTVEETHQKTFIHVPFWSWDVSKLMNPKDDHDWQLLSSHLGYSNDDITGWAQQSDPCMAMLNEWYATHKTSEGTLGIMTALQEIDRMDAAVIVENAMKVTDGNSQISAASSKTLQQVYPFRTDSTILKSIPDSTVQKELLVMAREEHSAQMELLAFKLQAAKREHEANMELAVKQKALCDMNLQHLKKHQWPGDGKYSIV